jgi:hypothetical protein
LVSAAGWAPWPGAGASVAGVVLTPLVDGACAEAATPPSVAATWPPAAASARAEAVSAPRTACCTAEPGLLEVWAFGSLAGTGVAAAGVDATGAASSALGRRKSM